ncbi:idi-3 precursor [Fusarium austroafricanum]|uniref:Idi-3 n=1 Tax=Fusarium austroafricanum TaxID=2364996 RepID=A0A8H4NRF2_9HYPO|nr:idi-3 precursor [Fusarium austroafricanum]
MLAQTIFTALFAATATLAAPLERRSDDYFTPSAIHTYNIANGAIHNTDEGRVTKAPGNGGNDITTLLTFTYPEAARGKKCQFAFYLNGKENVIGSKKLDLYSSLAPAPGPRAGWGPGNQRNIHLGRMDVKVGGFATWEATYGPYMTQKTDCKKPGTVEGLELVGVYDLDAIYWNPAISGPRIVIS